MNKAMFAIPTGQFGHSRHRLLWPRDGYGVIGEVVIGLGLHWMAKIPPTRLSMNPIGNRIPSNPPPIKRLGTENRITMTPHTTCRRGAHHNASPPKRIIAPDTTPTDTKTIGANTASFGM